MLSLRVEAVIAVLGMFLLCGCSAGTASSPSSSNRVSALTTPGVPAIGGATVTETAQFLYGSRLLGVSLKNTDIGGGQVAAVIDLSSGEPTGTEPFALLEAFVRKYPGHAVYQMNYVLPAPASDPNENIRLSGYEWRVEDRTVSWSTGAGHRTDDHMEGESYLRGLASSMDTAALAATAARSVPLPTFRD